MILQRYRADVAISNDSPPPAIVAFEDYMTGAREIKQPCRLDTPRVRKGQLRKQKSGEVMQESFFLTDLEGKTFDFEACSRCNHRYLLPAGLDIAEVMKHNENGRK